MRKVFIVAFCYEVEIILSVFMIECLLSSMAILTFITYTVLNTSESMNLSEKCYSLRLSSAANINLKRIH